MKQKLNKNDRIVNVRHAHTITLNLKIFLNHLNLFQIVLNTNVLIKYELSENCRVAKNNISIELSSVIFQLITNEPI